MKHYALLLSIVTVTGCEYWPLPNGGSSDAGSFDAGSVDASTLDASSDAGDSGSVRDGATPDDVDGGGTTNEDLDAAVALDAAADCGTDFELLEDGGSASVTRGVPAWILARCRVGQHGHRGPAALLSAALSGEQLACIGHWLATLEP